VSQLFIGIMSGTSLDGVDAALVDFAQWPPRTLGFATVAIPADLRARLVALSLPGDSELEAAGELSLELADLYALAAKRVLEAASVDRASIVAVGCHGQTVRHRPERGFTIQLNDPARVAENCGIDVVADFRRRDLAAGGEGAPLVPAFHRAAFGIAGHSRCVVNIGGIANVTVIGRDGTLLGFDCGPGNMLLDAWASEHLGMPCDLDGAWSRGGKVDRALLERLLDEPYFRRSPPKSTGRELFNRGWLAQRLLPGCAPQDVQATLVQFTARAITDAIGRFAGGTEEIFLCGGGARNGAIVDRITQLGAPAKVGITDELGVPSGQVEAVAFAWLALRCVRREPVDLTAITGARHPCILGAIYPA
jgi:anhydro-N-acetylmuramic acid kinase